MLTMIFKLFYHHYERHGPQWESLDGAIDKVINYYLIKKKVCK